MSIRVKLHYGGRTFRRSVDPTWGYDSFNQWVTECFPSAPDHAVFTYIDEDGDRPCIASSGDLREALDFASRTGLPLRICIETEDGGETGALDADDVSITSASDLMSSTSTFAPSEAVASVATVPIMQQYPAPTHQQAQQQQQGGGVPPIATITVDTLRALQQSLQNHQLVREYGERVVPYVDMIGDPRLREQVRGQVRAVHSNIGNIVDNAVDHTMDVAARLVDRINRPLQGFVHPPPPPPPGPPVPPPQPQPPVFHAPPPPPPPPHAHPPQPQPPQQPPALDLDLYPELRSLPPHEQEMLQQMLAEAVQVAPSATEAVEGCDEEGGVEASAQSESSDSREATPSRRHRGRHHAHPHQFARGLHHPHHHRHGHLHGRHRWGRREEAEARRQAAEQQRKREAEGEGEGAQAQPPATVDGKPVHQGVRCDVCNTANIVGVRYKDAVRRDYDLCETCEGRGGNPFPMLKIRDPSQAPSAIVTVLPPEQTIDFTRDEARAHLGVACDRCQMNPIVGDRYKCTRRHNYDLCAECEAKDETGFPMLKITKPSQAPAFIYVTPQGVGPCKWARHQFTRHMWNSYADRCRRAQAHSSSSASADSTPAPSAPAHAQSGGGAAAEPLADDARHPVAVAEAEVVHLTQAQDEDELARAIKASLETPPPPPPQPASSAEDPDLDAAISASLKELESIKITQRDFELGGGAASGASSIVVNPIVQQAAPVEAVVVADQGSKTEARGPQKKTLSARFVADMTFPDGTIVQPRMELQKTWALSNNGTEPFPDDTRLVFAYGHRMEGPEEGVLVGSIKPGEEFQVTVPLLAPGENGQYVGCWHLEGQGPDGKPVVIGNRVWYDLTVNDEAAEGWCLLSGSVDAADAAAQDAADHEQEQLHQQQLEALKQELQLERLAESMGQETEAPVQKPQVQEEAQAETEAERHEAVRAEAEAGPAAPAPAEVERSTHDSDIAEWTTELQTLADMGFTDFDRCLALLQRHGRGEEAMQNVIQGLLQP